MERKRVSRRWRTVAVLAVGIAVGTSLAATPAIGHVGGTVNHLWGHVKPKADKRYANAVNGTDKAKDADKLDGIDATGFYPVGSKVDDSDRLDSLDSSAFVRTAGAYVRTLTSIGTLGDGFRFHFLLCHGGDKLLSAGYEGVDAGTHITKFSPGFGGGGGSNGGWWLIWQNDATVDTVTLAVLCADQ